ncbi:hypothetical protein [Streptomyces sp. NPDC126514]|uniref:hypothetical protein n=1 Tax=Streptomyces sp. NPDC126514 TaxID=3155210 RepID=UPI003324EA44
MFSSEWCRASNYNDLVMIPYDEKASWSNTFQFFQGSHPLPDGRALPLQEIAEDYFLAHDPEGTGAYGDWILADLLRQPDLTSLSVGFRFFIPALGADLRCVLKDIADRAVTDAGNDNDAGSMDDDASVLDRIWASDARTKEAVAAVDARLADHLKALIEAVLAEPHAASPGPTSDQSNFAHHRERARVDETLGSASLTQPFEPSTARMEEDLAEASLSWPVSFAFTLLGRTIEGVIGWNRLVEVYGAVSWPSPGMHVPLDPRCGLNLVCDEQGAPALALSPEALQQVTEATDRAFRQLWQGRSERIRYYRVGAIVLLALPDGADRRGVSALHNLLSVCEPDANSAKGVAIRPLKEGSKLRLKPADGTVETFLRSRDRQALSRSASRYAGQVKVQIYGPQGRIGQSGSYTLDYLVDALKSCGSDEAADQLNQVTTAQLATELSPTLTFDGTARPASLIVRFDAAHIANNAALFKRIDDNRETTFVQWGDLIVLLPGHNHDAGGWLLRFLHPEKCGSLTKRSRTVMGRTVRDRVDVALALGADQRAFTRYLRETVGSKRTPTYSRA